jgi:hypothetical protein
MTNLSAWPTIEDIEAQVTTLCDTASTQATALSDFCAHLKKVRDSYGTKEDPEYEKDMHRLVMVIARLNAISLIGKYEYLDMQQQRGVTTEYGMTHTNWGQPTNIKPSGQESAQIRLWSGMSHYTNSVNEMSEIK